LANDLAKVWRGPIRSGFFKTLGSNRWMKLLDADPNETRRLAYHHFTGELDDARHQLAGLAQTLQALPAVGAVTLALFAALATLPAYQDPLPTIFLALGLVPFGLLVAASALEFGRSEQKADNLPLNNAEDDLAPGDWLRAQISARRLDIAVLEATIVRKRNRLRLVSGLLAFQVGYLLIVTIVVAFLGASK
jgi:hypothetical protein